MLKIKKLRLFRLIIQIVFLVLLPELFALTFSELKTVYTMIVTGDFNFASVLPYLTELIFILIITILLGRVFCGWICAFGAFNDIISLLSQKFLKIKFRMSKKLDRILKNVKYMFLLFIVIYIWTMGSKLAQSASPWEAFAQLTNFKEAISQCIIGVILLGFIAIGSVFIERFFCKYLCPLGAVLSLSSKYRLLKISKPADKCGKCRKCTNSCPMSIKLYDTNMVDSTECINCLNCVSVCPRNNAQASILSQNINPAFAGSIAISGFIGLYSINTLGLFSTGMQSSSQANDNTQTFSDTNSQTNKYSPTVTEAPNTTTGSQATSNSQNKYKDGTFTGVGYGRQRGLNVSVTIKNNVITKVEILSNNETPSYARRAFNAIPAEIVKNQSINVNAVSGATLTSYGIMDAVNGALSNALN